MKLKNLMQYAWWIGVTLPLLLGCSLLVMPTPIPVSPTPTPLPTTPTPTPIPPTISPTSLPTTSPLVEQARAFAEPILQAIADHKPDFEDDFSTANKGWDWEFGGKGQEGTFAIRARPFRRDGTCCGRGCSGAPRRCRSVRYAENSPARGCCAMFGA